MLKEEFISKFDTATFFAYEMIAKEDLKKCISSFDVEANRISGDDRPKYSFSYFGRNRTNIVYKWEINDLDDCWKQIEEESQLRPSWPEMTKPFVKKFTLFAVEIPYLPYDAIVLKTDMDAEKAISVISSNEQLNVLAAINSIMERYPGIIKKFNKGWKYRPCYLKFEVTQDGKQIDEKAKKIKELLENKELDTDVELKKYYDASKALRIHHYDKDHKDWNALTLIRKQDAFSLIGYLDHMPDTMTYSNYEIVVKKKNRMLNWARNTVFGAELDYDFAVYFHYVSIHLFLRDKLGDLDELEVEFDGLVTEYRNIENKSISGKDDLYQRLVGLDEKLYFVKSDLNLIEFELNNPLLETMKRIPNFNLISPEQYSQEKRFSTGMLEATYTNSKNSLVRIDEKLSRMQKKTLDLKDKLDKKIMLENTVFMAKYSSRSFWLSVFTVALSTIIVAKIIFDLFGV